MEFLFNTPKRKRRTKAEMMAFRQAQTESSKLPKEAAFRDSQRFNVEESRDKELSSAFAYAASLIPKAGDSVPEPKKVAQKPNMELVEPILESKVGKIIEGWVNVYKGGPGSYWLGSDIYYTIEDAKRIGGHSTIAKVIKQIFISFIDDGE